MLGKIQYPEVTLFKKPLYEVLNSNQKKARSSYPVRLMAGLLIIIRLRNLSDETLVDERWKENGFSRYFCGAESYQVSKPYVTSDLIHSGKRIPGDKALK